jgi:hypothetical protein
MRRVAAVAVVVLVTPSLTYVLFGSLREGVSVTDKASQLPGYLSDTFLHLDFGYAPKFHEPRGRVLLDTMPVDIALLVGSLVFGGGHVVLPLLQAEVVPPGWLTTDQFIAGYGAAQAVPGPLFTFAAYLGAVPPVTPELGMLRTARAPFLSVWY